MGSGADAVCACVFWVGMWSHIMGPENLGNKSGSVSTAMSGDQSALSWAAGSRVGVEPCPVPRVLVRGVPGSGTAVGLEFLGTLGDGERDEPALP